VRQDIVVKQQACKVWGGGLLNSIPDSEREGWFALSQLNYESLSSTNKIKQKHSGRFT
jgi:hypothetical protein